MAKCLWPNSITEFRRSLPIAALCWDYVRFYPLKNSLLRQWPASSLSAGEVKLVVTVYKMAIAHCSHWLIAPKRLLLLIITKLVGWASKPGDCQKFELTGNNIKFNQTINILFSVVINNTRYTSHVNYIEHVQIKSLIFVEIVWENLQATSWKKRSEDK
jgi:hypothetical protein